MCHYTIYKAFFFMAEIRKYGSNRQIFSSDVLANSTREKTIICVDYDIIPMLVEFLATRGLWRTSYYASQEPQHYTLPDDDDFNTITNFIADNISELQAGYSMGCFDDVVGVLNLINGNLVDITSTLNKQAEITAQGQCGCQASGTNPIPVDSSVACETPEGFDSFTDYVNYSCKFVNWFYDKVIVAIKQIEQSFFWLYADYAQASSTERMSITQVYMIIAARQSLLIPTEWLYNLSDPTKSLIVQGMVDLYYRYATDKFLRVPETDTVEDVIADWYGAIGFIAEDLITNRTANIATLYSSQDLATFLSDWATMIDTAYTYADAQTPGQTGLSYAETIINALVDVGLAGLGWSKSVTINAFTSLTPCSGFKGCCPVNFTLTGIELGGKQYQSVLVDGVHTVDIIHNATGIGSTCSGAAEGVDPTADTGTITLYSWYTGDGSTLSGTSPTPTGLKCIRRWKFTSPNSFTVTHAPVAACT